MQTGEDPADSIVHLTLRLADGADGADTIAGLLEDESGAARPFRGWLELTALLDDARPRPPLMIAPEEW